MPRWQRFFFGFIGAFLAFLVVQWRLGAHQSSNSTPATNTIATSETKAQTRRIHKTVSRATTPKINQADIEKIEAPDEEVALKNAIRTLWQQRPPIPPSRMMTFARQPGAALYLVSHFDELDVYDQIVVYEQLGICGTIIQLENETNATTLDLIAGYPDKKAVEQITVGDGTARHKKRTIYFDQFKRNFVSNTQFCQGLTLDQLKAIRQKLSHNLDKQLPIARPYARLVGTMLGKFELETDMDKLNDIITPANAREPEDFFTIALYGGESRKNRRVRTALLIAATQHTRYPFNKAFPPTEYCMMFMKHCDGHESYDDIIENMLPDQAERLKAYQMAKAFVEAATNKELALLSSTVEREKDKPASE